MSSLVVHIPVLDLVAERVCHLGFLRLLRPRTETCKYCFVIAHLLPHSPTWCVLTHRCHIIRGQKEKKTRLLIIFYLCSTWPQNGHHCCRRRTVPPRHCFRPSAIPTTTGSSSFTFVIVIRRISIGTTHYLWMQMLRSPMFLTHPKLLPLHI